MAAGSVALYARNAGFPAGPTSDSIDVVTTLLVSILLLALFLVGMKSRPEMSARLIVSGVTIAGTISGLILLKVSLQASGVSPGIFLLALPLGYIGLNWSVRGYFGLLSPKRAAALMAGSATLLGALIGTSVPTAFSITFLFILTALDVVVVESNAIPSAIGKTGYDRVVSVATLPLEKYVVGLGDFLAYAILASSALHLIGLFGAIETSILILAGAVATFELTKARKKMPGLLLPVGLGLVPLVLGLLQI